MPGSVRLICIGDRACVVEQKSAAFGSAPPAARHDRPVNATSARTSCVRSEHRPVESPQYETTGEGLAGHRILVVWGLYRAWFSPARAPVGIGLAKGWGGH